ncbi:hypothetical protein GW17_00052249 [Ensete ventricosum]|nr:hypothetical protein GW17_00052249 [Ensete ventricosum]
MLSDTVSWVGSLSIPTLISHPTRIPARSRRNTRGPKHAGSHMRFCPIAEQVDAGRLRARDFYAVIFERFLVHERIMFASHTHFLIGDATWNRRMHVMPATTAYLALQDTSLISSVHLCGDHLTNLFLVTSPIGNFTREDGYKYGSSARFQCVQVSVFESFASFLPFA